LTLKIIVIRACAVGDFVLNLPALEALQASEPSSEFTLVGYPGTLEIARDFVNVSAVHSIEVEPWRRLFHSPIEHLAFERAIVWMKDASVAENLSRSGVKNVFRAAPFPTSGHAAAHLLRTLSLRMPDLPDRWHAETDRIILHPGSGSRMKCWPHFVELANRLETVAFLIGPAESDFNTGRHHRLENPSLREVSKLLRSSRAFVGNDSGITHLAAHLGVPTVAIFGPTDPRVWAPLGRRVSIIEDANLAAIHIDQIVKNLELVQHAGGRPACS
jgi:ADP-heptose:LPS heptosyltransferase